MILLKKYFNIIIVLVINNLHSALINYTTASIQHKNTQGNDFLDLKWIVGVFRHRVLDYMKHDYVFKCTGVLVKFSTVAVPTKCISNIPTGEIRVQENDMIFLSPKSAYRRHWVQTIHNTSANVSLLLLQNPITSHPVLITNGTPRQTRFVRNLWQNRQCLLFSYAAYNDEYTQIGLAHVTSLFKPDCCYNYGHTSKLGSFDIFGIDTYDSVSDECYNQLGNAMCFQYGQSSCTETMFNEGAVICMKNNKPYLQGIVIDKIHCSFLVAEITNKDLNYD